MWQEASQLAIAIIQLEKIQNVKILHTNFSQPISPQIFSSSYRTTEHSCSWILHIAYS